MKKKGCGSIFEKSHVFYWCYIVCEGRANSISSVIIEGGKPGAKVSPCD